MLAPASRRVRRLHLRAEADEDAARATTLLTDALHTASLPADRARLVVIRRLALGRISTRASPASLALRIEAVARDVLSEAVAYDLPSAAHANVVVFPDRSEAIVGLARVHARGEAGAEWFWDSVVPEWRRCATDGARWSALLDAASALPEGTITAAAVVEQAIHAGADDRLMSSLRPWQAVGWLRASGWRSVRPESALPAAATLTARHAAVVDSWCRAFGPRDDRVIWLGTMCAIEERPARAADPQLPSKLARLLIERFEQAPQARHLPATHPEHQGAPSEVSSVPSVPGANHQARTSQPLSDAPMRAVGERRTDSVRAGSARAEGQTDEPATAPSVGRPPAPNALDWHFTPCAGLPFVIPILERLGFGRFLEAHPDLLESEFPLRLVMTIGQSAGVADIDPLFQLLKQAAPVDLDVPADADGWLAAWRVAVRRWSRRRLRLPLNNLIRRPGRVHLSRTHLETVFDLAQLDLTLRRVALDVDPGWVPWLGRVVRFHYGDPDDRGR